MSDSIYTVIKQCRAMLTDRTMITLNPGDDFPPNAVVGNPVAWINNGFIRRKDNSPEPVVPGRSLPSIPATAADVKRSKSAPPQPGEPIEAPLGGNGGVLPYEKPLVQKVTRAQLGELTKADLSLMAQDVGLEMPRSATKDEMIDRLLEAAG